VAITFIVVFELFGQMATTMMFINWAKQTHCPLWKNEFKVFVRCWKYVIKNWIKNCCLVKPKTIKRVFSWCAGGGHRRQPGSAGLRGVLLLLQDDVDPQGSVPAHAHLQQPQGPPQHRRPGPLPGDRAEGTRLRLGLLVSPEVHVEKLRHRFIGLGVDWMLSFLFLLPFPTLPTVQHLPLFLIFALLSSHFINAVVFDRWPIGARGAFWILKQLNSTAPRRLIQNVRPRFRRDEYFRNQPWSGAEFKNKAIKCD